MTPQPSWEKRLRLEIELENSGLYDAVEDFIGELLLSHTQSQKPSKKILNKKEYIKLAKKVRKILQEEGRI